MFNKEIDALISNLIKDSEKELNRKNYNGALRLVSTCASLLYKTNAYYSNDNIESIVQKIAGELDLNSEVNLVTKKNTVVFWDGFGFNNRGIAKIYLNALCQCSEVVYITYEDRKNEIPDILNMLRDFGARYFFINRKSDTIVDRIRHLNDIIKEIVPESFFFYSMPDDVVATPILYAYEGVIKRYIINLTDHSFWLGAGAADRCLEFRNYGASVSYKYRNIEKEKIRIIPIYTMIKKDEAFQGFPSTAFDGKKYIFSGGALYKTYSEDNLYYIMLDEILKCHEDIFLWYAGGGNAGRLERLMEKYPGRVFHTDERTDLYQVMERCRLYLSTYPISGGIMFQYAALAGKVPVTLMFEDVSDETLINQRNLNIEFYSLDELLAEVEKLLNDDDYADERGELMQNSVQSPEAFDEMVANLFLENEKCDYSPVISNVDTEQFRDMRTSKITRRELNGMLVHEKDIASAIKYYPCRMVDGCFVLAGKVLRRYVFKK